VRRSPAPSALAIWAGLITLYLVWGSTYLAIRVAIDTIPPYLMIAIRFFIAGGLLFAWSLLRGQVLPHPPTRREWRDSFIVGTLLLCGAMGLVAIAEQTVPTGITALLIALMPAWVAVLGRIFFGERLVPLVRRDHRRARWSRRARRALGQRADRHVWPDRRPGITDPLGGRLALLCPPGDVAQVAHPRDVDADALRGRRCARDRLSPRRIRAVR
jgi:hypothetical protein